MHMSTCTHVCTCHVHGVYSFAYVWTCAFHKCVHMSCARTRRVCIHSHMYGHAHVMHACICHVHEHGVRVFVRLLRIHDIHALACTRVFYMIHAHAHAHAYIYIYIYGVRPYSYIHSQYTYTHPHIHTHTCVYCLIDACVKLFTGTHSLHYRSLRMIMSISRARLACLLVKNCQMSFFYSTNQNDGNC